MEINKYYATCERCDCKFEFTYKDVEIKSTGRRFYYRGISASEKNIW